MTAQMASSNAEGSTSLRSGTAGDMLRQFLVIVATIGVITVNGLANALPINGQQTGDISDRFNVYFVPAGYVFSIWGLIYLGLIGYTVFQALPSQRANPRLRAVGYLYVASSVANIVWIFLWHYEQFAWTLVAMLALLGLLIAIYQRLGIGLTPMAGAERWLVRLTFSVYLGWITVATVANVTTLLDYLGWNGWGIAPVVWAVIMLGVATVVGLGVILMRSDWAYGLVLVWAFAGIAVKHSATPAVMFTAVICAVIVAAAVALALFRPLQTRSA
jgi:benzodiazapine receptor